MTSVQAPKAHIIVVGSGFAGIGAYTALRKKGGKNVKITLVSDTLFFWHIPLIHEVAAGTIQPELVYWPVTEYVRCPKREFLHARVQRVDADTKILHVEEVDGDTVALPYDALVLAMGSVPFTFGTPGAEEHALPFRALHDAERIRNRILDVCNEARETTDEVRKKELLSFILVGGGATGIELAGELVEVFSKEIACRYPDLTQYLRITIVERSGGLLKERDPWVGMKVLDMLKHDGVQVLFGRHITKVTEDGLEIQEGNVRGKTVIWTGGARATDITIESNVAIVRDEKSQRIVVTPFLNIEHIPDIYVAGDQAFALQKDGTPYGMRAQFATRQGKQAALNILSALKGKKQKPFIWSEKGMIITIGKGRAIADIRGMRFTGVIAWIICHAVYILAIVGWKLRLKSAWYWTKHFVRERNICQISRG